MKVSADIVREKNQFLNRFGCNWEQSRSEKGLYKFLSVFKKNQAPDVFQVRLHFLEDVFWGSAEGGGTVSCYAIDHTHYSPY